MPSQEFDHLFKLIIIGDSGVGKSCLMHRVTTNEFMEDHEVTVGVEFGTLLMKIEDTNIKLQIWDTAGQENFQSITKIFYRGAHAVFLTYNITSLESFQNTDNWFSEVKAQSEPDATVFLIGNKKDCENEREVGLDKAEKFKQIKNLDHFSETSAKTGENVKETFITVAKMLYQKNIQKILSTKRDHSKKGGKKLQRGQTPAKRGCKQC